jgi:hypothetical protein
VFGFFGAICIFASMATIRRGHVTILTRREQFTFDRLREWQGFWVLVGSFLSLGIGSVVASIVNLVIAIIG